MASKNTMLQRCAARRRRVAKLASEQKVDAMLISKHEDVGYLSGFTGEDATLLIAPRWTVLITDGRFGQQGPRECPDIEVVIRKKDMAETIRKTLHGRKVRKLGLQGANLTAAAVEAASTSWTSASSFEVAVRSTTREASRWSRRLIFLRSIRTPRVATPIS